jgi:hypothetical protein
MVKEQGSCVQQLLVMMNIGSFNSFLFYVSFCLLFVNWIMCFFDAWCWNLEV